MSGGRRPDSPRTLTGRAYTLAIVEERVQLVRLVLVKVEVMGDNVSDLALSIDKVLSEARDVAESIARGPGGREIALAITRLQEARHWVSEAHEEKHKAQ